VLLSAGFLQTYFPTLSMQWYDTGTWSVATEMFFYVLFPLALPLLLRFQQPGMVLGLLVATVLAGTALGLVYVRVPHVFAFPPCRFPEFVAGMLAALLGFRFGWRAPAWAAVGLLVATAGYLAYAGPRLPGTLIHNWLVLPTLVVLLNVLAQPRQSRAFAWLGSPPMEYLGRISYSFYIAQHPLVFVLDPLLKAGRLSHTDWRIAPLALVLNLVGAVLLYELVEKPAQTYLIARHKARAGQAGVAPRFA
jgi:peptidoglycan/LPS O-acetylase OafA/YrhL